MSGRVQDKVALVVGAGSVGEGWGNGKAAAALYAREGARVLAADLNLAAAEETRDIILKEGGEAVACQADATAAKSVEAMVGACMDAYGRVDILHNNVGGSEPGGPVEMSEEVWDANIDLNLKSVFLACKYVLPIMERQGSGAIVNISSVAGFTYYGNNLIAYKAAKSGLVQLTRGVAMQYAKKGIRANTVIPGLMNTPLVQHRIVSQYGGTDIDEVVARRDAMCPTGKMGDAWDVAYASLYLASDEAKYVTAAEIYVDGGLTAKSA